MNYKDYTKEAIKDFDGKDDSLLCDNYTITLAEGDGWVARLQPCGEIRGVLTTESGEEDIYNSNINEFFETNEDLNKAESDGKLILNNNNWFDLEFIAEGQYLDIVSDDSVVFSVREGVDTFKDYMADPNFIKELTEKVEEHREHINTIKQIFEPLATWIINNLDVQTEEDMPLMFRQPYQDVLTEIVMERIKK